MRAKSRPRKDKQQSRDSRWGGGGAGVHFHPGGHLAGQESFARALWASLSYRLDPVSEKEMFKEFPCGSAGYEPN